MTGFESASRDSKNFERLLEQASGNTFLIVTEGKKTEPNYLKALCRHLRLQTATIEHPDCTDPLSLVAYALDRMEKQKKMAKKGNAVDFNEVWVVFDLEKKHDERRRLAHKAKLLKGAQAIRFVESSPSFEFWLLLHFDRTTHPFTDSKEVEKRLKHYWPSYDKNSIPTDDLLARASVAIASAKFCRKHHEDCGGDGNPSTGMDFLVQNLNQATRRHHRLF